MKDKRYTVHVVDSDFKEIWREVLYAKNSPEGIARGFALAKEQGYELGEYSIWVQRDIERGGEVARPEKRTRGCVF